MASEIHWGYRYGPSRVQTMKMTGDNTSIKIGDLVAVINGCVVPATSGDQPIGVALANVENAAGSPDGVTPIPIETSSAAIYEYPIDSSTVTQDLVGSKRELATAQSINHSAGMSGCAFIWAINVARNTVEVSFTFENAFTV